MKVKIALLQMAMGCDIDTNLNHALRMIKEAAQKGANIICLPEIFTTEYFPQQEKCNFEKFAQSIPGKTTDALAKAAKDNKVVLIGGSIFEKDEEKFYNTTTIYNQNGKMLGKYRKIHIPHDPSFYEQNYFTKGDLGYKVFETEFGRIGTLICYDQWFPEAARINALMGAEILAYATAIGKVNGIEEKEGNWQEAWETVQRGHAIANGVIVVSINRVGTENETTFWGRSFICDAFGRVLVRGSAKEEIIIAECDLEHGKEVREGWGFFYNRRPDTYRKLVEKR